jgi:hypothetical protein
MATPYLKSWTPGTTYEFDLRIGDRDYSNDLYSVSIKSAINTPYQNVDLELYLDPNDIITDKIYGQAPIKFNVTLKGESTWPQQTVKFELMFSGTEADYQMQKTSQLRDQSERSPIIFSTVSRNAYTTMSKMVNSVYFGQTPESIVRSILANTDAKIEYDTNGKNGLKIDQLLIPPSSVYKTVNYLDRTYGLFNGMMAFHCSHDNVAKIQNLSTKIGSSQAFTIYTLATDMNQEKILSMTEIDKFYTKTPVKVMNRGNSIFAVVSPRNRYITKPRDRLSHTIDIESEEFVKSHGIISRAGAASKESNRIYYDTYAIKDDSRITYHTDQTGYDLDEGFVKSNLSRAFGDVSLVSIQLQHRLPILNLLNVGEAVNLIPQVSDYKNLGGFYILKASDIGWVRSKVWESWARVYLMRSNISSG